VSPVFSTVCVVVTVTEEVGSGDCFKSVSTGSKPPIKVALPKCTNPRCERLNTSGIANALKAALEAPPIEAATKEYNHVFQFILSHS
jgi:hypothetical protein